MESRSTLRRTLVAFVSLAVGFCAQAHDRTTSYSSWQLSKTEAHVVLNMSEVEAAALGFASDSPAAFNAAIGQYAVRHLALLSSDHACPVLRQPRRLDGAPGRVILEWSLASPAEADLSIRSDLLFEIRPGHLHFANLRYESGVAQRVLTGADRAWELGAEARTRSGATKSTSLGSYAMLGVGHIATGYDHLVFLLALLLAGGTFTSVIKVVTGFTVGHSITLGLASLGFVQPEIGPVEALIGLTIALVAVENVWLLGARTAGLPVVMVVLLGLLTVGAAFGLGRVSDLSCLGLAVFLASYYPLLCRYPQVESARWTVALVFGLIHGFSFASVLRAAGLPPDRLPAVLVSFNLGVEAGQVVVVAMAWPLLRLALARWRALVIEVGSAVTLGLGIYWFVSRTFA